MSRRQTRLDTKVMIHDKMDQLIGEKVNIVTLQGVSYFGIVKSSGEDKLMMQNIGNKTIEIRLKDIYEIIIDKILA